ncbi:hypothetical protein BFU36_06850 [Sulfolobus sp. A20]|uniref:hypothetical protein n=1 Tax=Sulfolobaceae TaxID=118883 RepID=UPI000845C7DB|nr:hypothetical protein [Sulfolobus sp. B1]AOL17726.1 hypothetical protein BFU36_06850 [Sulfolobus sp. A20]TRM75233.1 hypothetical protein DJ532_10725 [Sulfolobus sp. A20-N-F8]TRM76818.1 hypothetical protein DJ528_07780 [Sulfolobus sp. B5]TRM81911.1 hypothetical protein DJ522_07615 [Sulfolobus sp. F3]TRM82067.1 hypothetical protein DJ524_01920 [Sulfolobus sp. D5]TRM83573.1 hypothetical protein DJ531_04835 [Sulfolobus sp. A20-N-F6]TRM95323.1 hypothetical protein DJ526_00775 [Sulfolobus sp. A2
MGLVLAYLFPLDEALPITIFWIFLTYLLLRVFFRGEVNVINTYNGKSKWAILASYMSVHYVLYSIALETLLTYLFRPVIYPQSSFVGFFTTPFGESRSFANLGLSLVFNPTITIFISPNFAIDLSLYSIVFGLLISILVTSILISILSINGKQKYIILVPLLGLIAGASCCVSIPILLAESVELANIVFISTTSWQALFIAYISLPIITVIFLKHLSNSLIRLRAKIN